MTQEEKAKAYDEAIKKAKEAVEKGMVSHNFVSDIFPELNESEDERIKNPQIEQNPAWSKDDEMFLTTALWHISNSVSNGKDTECHCATIEWLKSLKDRIQQP